MMNNIHLGFLLIILNKIFFFKTDEELKGEEIFLLPMDTDILTIQGLFRMTNIPPREFQLIVSSPNINNTEFKVNPRQRSSRNN